MGKIKGTREWAVAEVSCSLGCPYGCRYCYARHDAITRQELVEGRDWQEVKTAWNPSQFRKYHGGRVMFPAAHDMVAENLKDCLAAISLLLEHDNRLLLVSKPSLTSIRTLCQMLLEKRAREKILFRFTITARDPAILAFWEPGAPSYAERLQSLIHCQRLGFATSVSVEPMLDGGDVVAMVEELLPHVSHSIWLGKMNKIKTRVACKTRKEQEELARILRQQEDSGIKKIYARLKDNPLIRWKESIKEVVGLPLASRPGLDR